MYFQPRLPPTWPLPWQHFPRLPSGDGLNESFAFSVLLFFILFTSLLLFCCLCLLFVVAVIVAFVFLLKAFLSNSN